MQKAQIKAAAEYLEKQHEAVLLKCTAVINAAENSVKNRAYLQSSFTIGSVVTGAMGAVVIVITPANVIIAAIASSFAGIFAGLREFYSDEGTVGKQKLALIEKRKTLINDIKEADKDWSQRMSGDELEPIKNTLIRRAEVIDKLTLACQFELSPFDSPKNINKPAIPSTSEDEGVKHEDNL